MKIVIAIIILLKVNYNGIPQEATIEKSEHILEGDM